MNNNSLAPNTIKVKQFQTINWPEQYVIQNEETGEQEIKMRQIILIYALGEDGNVYEFNGTWLPIPIQTDNLRKLPNPPLEIARKPRR